MADVFDALAWYMVDALHYEQRHQSFPDFAHDRAHWYQRPIVTKHSPDVTVRIVRSRSGLVRVTVKTAVGPVRLADMPRRGRDAMQRFALELRTEAARIRGPQVARPDIADALMELAVMASDAAEFVQGKILIDVTVHGGAA